MLSDYDVRHALLKYTSNVEHSNEYKGKEEKQKVTSSMCLVNSLSCSWTRYSLINWRHKREEVHIKGHLQQPVIWSENPYVNNSSEDISKTYESKKYVTVFWLSKNYVDGAKISLSHHFNSIKNTFCYKWPRVMFSLFLVRFESPVSSYHVSTFLWILHLSTWMSEILFKSIQRWSVDNILFLLSELFSQRSFQI